MCYYCRTLKEIRAILGKIEDTSVKVLNTEAVFAQSIAFNLLLIMCLHYVNWSM